MRLVKRGGKHVAVRNQSTALQMVCLSGATHGTLAVRLEGPAWHVVASAVGPGVQPFESEPEDLYRSIRCSMEALASCAPSWLPAEAGPLAFVVAMSGQTSADLLGVLRRAVADGVGTAVAAQDIRWITRGRGLAEPEAVGNRPVLVLKAGTVAFAQHFSIEGGLIVSDRRAGGWGPLTGNDGGAYYIGSRMLGRFFHELDGRAPTTKLTELSQSLVGHDALVEPDKCVAALLSWIRRSRARGTLKQDVASLAQTCAYLHREVGDPFCGSILEEAAEALLCSARALLASVRSSGRLALVPTLCLLHGAVLLDNEHYRRRLDVGLETLFLEMGFPPPEIKAARHRPLLGCLVFGLREVAGYSAREAREVALAAVANDEVFSEGRDDRPF